MAKLALVCEGGGRIERRRKIEWFVLAAHDYRDTILAAITWCSNTRWIVGFSISR